MVENVKMVPTVTTSDIERIKEFMLKGQLLSRACKELGLDYSAVRRNLIGETEDVKLGYAVSLKQWVFMWNNQEAERKDIPRRVKS